MSKRLELVRNNTDDDLHNAKIDAQVLFVRCKSCGAKYMASIGEIINNPACKRCGQ
jgi:hypothetical protein